MFFYKFFALISCVNNLELTLCTISRTFFVLHKLTCYLSLSVLTTIDVHDNIIIVITYVSSVILSFIRNITNITNNNSITILETALFIYSFSINYKIFYIHSNNHCINIFTFFNYYIFNICFNFFCLFCYIF